MAAASSMLTAASLSFSALPSSRLRAAASFAAAPRRAKAAPVAVRASAASSKSTAAAEAAPKKKRVTGITQPKPVSPALQAIVGAPEIPRTEALKRLWAYIKQHNLQVHERNPYLLSLYL
jgi:chromatin remodeling complex protein RSC6